MRAWLTYGVLAGSVLAMTGCNRNPPTQQHPARINELDPLSPESFRERDPFPGSAMSPLVAPTQPGAAGAVEAALEGFRTGHLDMVFDALPPSFQQDANDLVHEFAANVDPELWSLTIGVLDQANKVLRVKKSLLLPLFPPSVDGSANALPTAWDEFTSAADLLIHNHLDDLDELKAIDVQDWLRHDANRTMRRMMTLSSLANPGRIDPLTALSQVQIDLVESTETTARVRISPPGQPPNEPTEFVKVEGKWIPKTLAEAWPDAVNTIRQSMRMWSNASIAPQTDRVRDMLIVCHRVLEQMLMAETTEQLGSAATPLFLQADQLSKQMTTPLPSIPDGPLEGVSLLILRELSDDELTRLLQTLEPLTDDPALEYHLATANGGKTYVSIKPVRDVTAFAAKLTFGTDPVTDPAARTITLRDVEFK